MITGRAPSIPTAAGASRGESTGKGGAELRVPLLWTVMAWPPYSYCCLHMFIYVEDLVVSNLVITLTPATVPRGSHTLS